MRVIEGEVGDGRAPASGMWAVNVLDTYSVLGIALVIGGTALNSTSMAFIFTKPIYNT